MVDDNELVRVRLDGFELNLGRAYAESIPGAEVLDEPVRLPDGSVRPQTRTDGRPVKPKVTVDQLRDQIRAVNATRPDDQQIPLSGTKDELTAALDAADTPQGNQTENGA